MSAYLFVHFREKTTPEGEQVYFGLSRDGFSWEAVNNGRPVLWAYYGEKGVRDHTIVRNIRDGRYHIIATDLSLAYGMRGRFSGSWEKISSEGSKMLAIWSSDDLVNWTEQRLIKIASDEMGCAWAPDIIYDRQNEDYVLHWSASVASDQYREKSIYYSRTKDFETFSEPACLYEKEDSGVIDSAMYEENGIYYLLVKSENNPSGMILLQSHQVTGPWNRVRAFDEALADHSNGLYEAPTALRTQDGRVCLFLDFYGAKGAQQGYVPFVATNFAAADFKRSDETFFFPYGFKHGTILEIGDRDYDRIKAYNFDKDDYSSYG